MNKINLILSAVLLYLIGDAFVFDGPLNQMAKLQKFKNGISSEEALKTNTAAVVCGYPITKKQIDRAAKERNLMVGKNWENLNEAEKKSLREEALSDLIDYEILRSMMKSETQNFVISKERIQEAYKAFALRFDSPNELKRYMSQNGIHSEKELKSRITAGMQREDYLEKRFSQFIKDDSEEVLKWYEKNKELIASPPRIKVRHIFVATLEKEITAAKIILEQALMNITKKEKSFEQIAAEISEDEFTKLKGGDLGWISTKRIAVDFSHAAMGLEVNQPTLIQTKLGWHIVEVTDKKEAEVRSFEECREEIVKSLAHSKRLEFMKQLRKSLREKQEKNIHIYTKVMN
jgi:parvulin-like peptidyl-prolyl isomerase